jgi:signal transduction histidine kinase/CheY-like chemotaxis protein
MPRGGAEPMLEFWAATVGVVLLVLVPSALLFRSIRALLARTRELERANAELARAREAADMASEAKSAFLSTMSHELRTPLNAIIGYSEMLAEDAEAEAQPALAADLAKIRRAGKHLLSLINDLLDLSKIEAGRMALYLEGFDVAEMVGDVAASVQPLVTRNGNALQVACAAGVGTMRADLTKVRQILLNLTANASKFTERGHIGLAVSRSRTRTGEWLVFEVRDTGIGMTPAQLERLFQPFVQAEASTARTYGGTGLGLTIARRFCRLMGGTITVESEPGRGSCFRVRLPAEVEEPEDGNTGERSTGMTAEHAALLSPGASTVLMIDDDPPMHDVMRRMLAREGYHLMGALSGPEGLAVARAIRPAVVLLDVMMPGQDGWQVLRALKAEPALANIPVVMLTALDERPLAFALGAADYVAKPVVREELVRALGAAAGRPHDMNVPAA